MNEQTPKPAWTEPTPEKEQLRFRVESLTADPWGESELANFKFRNEAIFKMFPTLISPFVMPVGLDLGSGTGTLSHRLSGFYRKLTCVDSDEGSIMVLRAKYAELVAVCSTLPDLPQVRDIDVVTMFGTIFYMTSDQIATLCRRLAAGVLQPHGLFIVNNLSLGQQRIIERNGFILLRTVPLCRPKHRLSFLSVVVTQCAFVKAIVDNPVHPDVHAFLSVTKNETLKWLHRSGIPCKSALVGAGCQVLKCIFRPLANSVMLFKMLFVFGAERQDYFVFGLAQPARRSETGRDQLN